MRPYFHRYLEDAIDLCDALSSFSSQARATLHEISRVMGLPGKPIETKSDPESKVEPKLEQPLEPRLNAELAEASDKWRCNQSQAAHQTIKTSFERDAPPAG